MYIFELISKLLKNKKNEITPIVPDFLASQETDSDDSENCQHIFIPIDSTKQTLACSKCGFVMKTKDFKNKNFFLND